MTPELIFGIFFGAMFLIILCTIFILYLGGRTTVSTYIYLYIFMFFLAAVSAMYFAKHIDEINNKNLPPTELRP